MTPAVARSGEKLAHPGGRILVLEEDRLVARLIVDSLERAGFEVLLALNGVSALSMVSEGNFVPRMLVTDLLLSGMSGLTVADELCAFLPELRVIVTSGYAYPSLADRGCLKRDYQFLPKPFGPRELVRTVSQGLADS